MKDVGEQKKEGTREVTWANAVIDWRGRERAGKKEQMRGERGEARLDRG